MGVNIRIHRGKAASSSHRLLKECFWERPVSGESAFPVPVGLVLWPRFYLWMFSSFRKRKI